MFIALNVKLKMICVEYVIAHKTLIEELFKLPWNKL